MVIICKKTMLCITNFEKKMSELQTKVLITDWQPPHIVSGIYQTIVEPIVNYAAQASNNGF